MIGAIFRGLLIICSLTRPQIYARPVSTDASFSLEHIKQAKHYLQKYGYMREEGATKTDFENALKKFQTDVGQEIDGFLNQEIFTLMSRPRCGTPTSNNPKLYHGRPKRFVPHNEKWERRMLSWKLSDPFRLLASYDLFIARNTLHRAFNDWSMATQRALRFVEIRQTNETADMEIFFALGAHNDSLPFDGTNGVVAHGFYPTDGNLHFDAAEKWTLNMPEGINLYQTALHEIGHLLGLEHSTDYRAVMFPINRSYDPQFRLSEDDIRGIRYLYNPWTWSYYIKQFSPWESTDEQKVEN